MPQKIDSGNLHLAITIIITITALPHHDSPINLELVNHPSLHVVTEVHILQDLSDYATTNRSKARILAKQVNVLIRVVWSQSSPPPAGAAGRVFPPKKLHQKNWHHVRSGWVKVVFVSAAIRIDLDLIKAR